MLEIACFNLASCLIAEAAGAHRIEFCRDYSAGGLTPEKVEIVEAKKKLRIPLHVIIRPKSGNFVYSKEEKEIMKADILFCKAHDIHGIVIGVLKADGSVDEEFCREVLQLASPMSCTFHRAIDECRDISVAVDQLAQLGFQRVLSSGGTKTAQQGAEALKKLQDQFSDRIIIMPGGGIRSNNIAKIGTLTGCREFHSAAMIGNAQLCDKTEIIKMRELVD